MTPKNISLTISEKDISYEEYIARIDKEKIPVYEPSLGDEELSNLSIVISSNWISEGKYTREFEARLAELCQRSYSVAFSNATSALIAGMKSLGIGTGDEVIVPSFSHSADANSISVIGATPVFADVEKDTLCLSPDTIGVSLTEKTKAVLYVCAYGNVGDLDQISEFCKAHNLILINDCAPALGGSYRGKSIASYGAFSVLSFFADKTITTGEGGMLLTDDIGLVSECNIYKHDGRKERGHGLIERQGYNFRISEFQSAVGVAQLGKLDHKILRKKQILEHYGKMLSGSTKTNLFSFNSDGDIVPHRIVLFVDAAIPLIDHLGTLGIGARPLFSPMHLQPCYDRPEIFKITDKIYLEGLELPSSPTLSIMDIEYITNSIKEYFK